MGLAMGRRALPAARWPGERAGWLAARVHPVNFRILDHACKAWFAQHERNYRPLTALAPSELKARARTAGASQADIDAIVQNPRRPKCVCSNLTL